MIPDPWTSLRRHTTARIALGRAGASMPTSELLSFAADHADARDAVHSTLDVPALLHDLAPLGLPVLTLHSRAFDRMEFLKSPDLGRRLNEPSTATVTAHATPNIDIALIIGDGLSAVAAQHHASTLLAHLLPRLQAKGFSIGPLCLVSQARVAIQDEIGSLLQAKVAVILLGERPGLGTADSLGVYLVFNPSIGKTDAQRNCVSNIRPGSFEPPAAADLIAWLVEQSLLRQLSGVNLKDERDPHPLPAPPPRTITIHRDSVFTFRFTDNRKIPRFHLDGIPKGTPISVIRINPNTGERFAKITDALVGNDGWVDLIEPIIVRAGEGFIAVLQ